MNQVYGFLGLESFKIKRFIKHQEQKYRPMTRKIRLQLETIFKPHNKELDKLLGIQW